MAKHVHGWRRVWRWTRRLVLGALTLAVVLIVALVIFIHTNYGREVVRKRVEARLQAVFPGGATIGKLEGSVFGTIVLRDVELDGPDGRPVIRAKTLRFGLALFPLLAHRIRITDVVLEDADVALERNARGELIIARLIPKLSWSIELPEVRALRAHVAFDAGFERFDFDGVDVSGSLLASLDQDVAMTFVVGGWVRQRGVLFGAEATVRSWDDALEFSGTAGIGGVRISAHDLRLTPPSSAHPASFAGGVFVTAPKAAVAQLVPGLELPADLECSVEMMPRDTSTLLVVNGHLDGHPLVAAIDVDLAAMRGRGWLATEPVDIGPLTSGRLHGSGSLLAVFDVVAPQPLRRWPTGTVMLHVDGDFAQVSRARVAIALTSRVPGEIAAVVGVAGPAISASGAGELRDVGHALVLDHGTLAGRWRDLIVGTGKTAIRANAELHLTACGELAPHLELAVAGTAMGSRVRAAGVSIEAARLVFDARGIPDAPRGRAELSATGVTHGSLSLRQVALTAANRADGTIAVFARARPNGDAWRFDADARVRLGESTTVELLHHHVHAGPSDWTGTTGRVSFDASRIELRDFVTTRSGGADRLAVAGVFQYSGRRAGDLTATIDAARIDLDAFATSAHGILDAHIDVARTHGRLTGVVDVRTTGAVFGTAHLEGDVDAPADPTDAAAWKRLGRSAVHSGRVTFTRVDLGRVAELVGLDGHYGGRLDGDIRISPQGTAGRLSLRDAIAPQLGGRGAISVELGLAQSSPGELTYTAFGRFGGISGITGSAVVAIPDHVFDPDAWRRGAITSSSLRVTDLDLDPELLERFGIHADLRGSVTLVAETTRDLRDARLSLSVRQLRGAAIAEPIDLELTISPTIDARALTARMSVRSTRGPLTEVTGTVGITLAALLAHPRAALAAPLELTAAVPTIPVQRLLAVLGRTEVTSGTLAGRIAITGTIATATVKAHLDGADLQLQPRRRGAREATANLGVDATWDGTSGTLLIDGTQGTGMLHLAVAGSPWQLGDATAMLEARAFDLSAFAMLAPGPAGGAAGQLDGRLSILGLDPATARLTGELHLTRARLPISPAVGTLRRATIDVVVRDRDIRMVLDGRLGGGTIHAHATIGLDAGAPATGDIGVRLRGVSPIGSIEPTVDADVTAKLLLVDGVWVANVVVDKARIKVPKDSAEALKPIGLPADVRIVTREPPRRAPTEKLPLAQPLLIATVVLRPTEVESEELRSVVAGTITLTTDGRSVGIVGTVDAERGDLDLFGRRYRVERATASFDGSSDPLIDVRITHDFADVTTLTAVHGRLSKPELVMASDPATYSQGQLLGFLLGGEPHGDPATGSLKDSAAGAGTSLVATRLGGYVRKALPIDLDVFRYEAATSTNSGVITIGTWVSHRLFVGYRNRTGSRPDENFAEGQVEYWLSQRTVVEATGGDRGFGGVDLLWRRRY